MKKPILAGVGLVGACAACCAVPLALPVLSGLSAGGIAGALGWNQLSAGGVLGPAVGVTAAASGLAMWLSRRATSQPTSCTLPWPRDGHSDGCGCKRVG